MLKKNPYLWKQAQTQAIKELKQKLYKLPPFTIPGEGKQILQIDANDNFWSAVLIKERDGKRFICGFKSGKFSNFKSHYHSTYKKTLAVKYEIQKFQFHLIGYTFTIEIDNQAFPRILKLKT